MSNKERPILKDLIRPQSKTVEIFQNQVIRPVIKMQHDFIIATFQNYLKTRKVSWSSFNENEKDNFLISALTKDSKLKYFFIGSIVGIFSNNELATYNDMKNESDRRIKQIILQRLKDSKTELK